MSGVTRRIRVRYNRILVQKLSRHCRSTRSSSSRDQPLLSFFSFNVCDIRSTLRMRSFRTRSYFLITVACQPSASSFQPFSIVALQAGCCNSKWEIPGLYALERFFFFLHKPSMYCLFLKSNSKKKKEKDFCLWARNKPYLYLHREKNNLSSFP